MNIHPDGLSPLNTFKQNEKYASLLTKLTNPLRHILKRPSYQSPFYYRWLSPYNLICEPQQYSQELLRIWLLHKPNLLLPPCHWGTVLSPYLRRIRQL